LPIRLPAGLLALGWLIFSAAGSSLAPPFFLLYFLSTLFLLPVQNAANAINATIDTEHDRNNKFSLWNKVAIVISVV
jgi:4-hydroxybenzoate polyprenyltransferase